MLEKLGFFFVAHLFFFNFIWKKKAFLFRFSQPTFAPNRGKYVVGSCYIFVEKNDYMVRKLLGNESGTSSNSVQYLMKKPILGKGC